MYGGGFFQVWKLPEGKFLRNHSGHDAIINAVAVNRGSCAGQLECSVHAHFAICVSLSRRVAGVLAEDVMVSGADNGSVKFWDWSSGYDFQVFDVRHRHWHWHWHSCLYHWHSCL